MMKGKRHIALLIPAFALTLHASEKDSAIVEHIGAWQQVNAQQRMNPALQGVAFTTSYSQLSAEVDYRKQTEAFVLEKGEGFFLTQASVNTYLRLSDRTAVWGHASYMDGKQRNVTWNSTSDFDLLRPYVLGDTLGGDTHRERYQFSGGYATQLNRWHVGAEMLFRAEHEYRDVDPRMRGIVNDLTLRLGGGHEALEYQWGLALEANVYKQTNDVDFYHELGVIPEYQLTGLGTVYGRFSSDKRTLYYQGGGVRILLDANPMDENGFYGHAEWQENRYHRVLAELNSLPLTDLYKQGVKATMGWKRAGEKNWAVYASFAFDKHSGDERIIGTSASSAYPVMGRRTMYKEDLMDASLNGIYGKNGDANWHVTAKMGYGKDSERYVYPERRLSVSYLYGGLGGEVFFNPTGKMLLTCNVDAVCQGNLTHDILMPFADMDEAFTQKVNHQYDYQKAHYASVSGSVRADYQVSGRYGIYAAVGGGGIFCSSQGHQLAARLSVGLTF